MSMSLKLVLILLIMVMMIRFYDNPNPIMTFGNSNYLPQLNKLIKHCSYSSCVASTVGQSYNVTLKCHELIEHNVPHIHHFVLLSKLSFNQYMQQDYVQPAIMRLRSDHGRLDMVHRIYILNLGT